MKTGELIILWVGGLLSITVLLAGRPDVLEIKTFGSAVVAVWIVQKISALLAIWIVCGLVWATVYRRARSDVKN